MTTRSGTKNNASKAHMCHQRHYRGKTTTMHKKKEVCSPPSSTNRYSIAQTNFRVSKKKAYHAGGRVSKKKKAVLGRFFFFFANCRT
jgi:hypothetical protein